LLNNRALLNATTLLLVYYDMAPTQLAFELRYWCVFMLFVSRI